MEFRVIYKETVHYDDIIDISESEMNQFFEFLIAHRGYNWKVINHYLEQETLWLLIQEYLDYFIEKLDYTPQWGEGLKVIEVTEEE